MSSSATSVNSTSTSASDYTDILQAATGSSSPGIDVTAAVAAAVAAAREPETEWENEQTTLTSQETALGSIQTATQNLDNDLNNLNSLTGPLSQRSVTSSNSSAVTATAANGTAAGTHSVVVNSLAQTAAWYSDEAASVNTTLPSTSFTITDGSGGTATFSTGSGSSTTTLSQLASAINSATDSNGKSLGLSASIISDATGSRLAIVSTTSGAASNFSVSSTNFTGTSWTSQELPTGDTLGADSLTVTVGSTPTTFTITSGETYAQLATAINNAGIGVTATAGSDSNGTTLSLASTDGSTSFSLNQPSFGFTQASAGADASLVVDGVPITSASNSVTNAISGVTLDLLGTGSGVTTTLTVASDATAAATAINQFVSDYNTALNLVTSQFTYSSTSSSQGALGSDSAVRQLQQTLESAVSYVASSSGTGSGTISSLSQMGISVTDDGTLAVDTNTLGAALVNNANDVQNFFEGASLNGFAASMNNALSTYTDPGNGAFTLDLQSMQTTYTNLTTSISDFETNYITPLKAELTLDLGNAESALEELPQQMQQINSMLGLSGSGSNG